MIDSQGWYRLARKVPSPHCDVRHDSEDISLLVVHNISLPPASLAARTLSSFFWASWMPINIRFLR
ncbi:N-acetylmuramoyl-L-alanine amidase AmpD [Vibrio cholerae]|nr:N-acetylmuramoyl-L-alanine amidase AmpD [Vibrio cholerae]GHZ05141.1 N-acetylmuramoyl-L-alanine amidase AmpD [Vibrio cholerae]